MRLAVSAEALRDESAITTAVADVFLPCDLQLAACKMLHKLHALMRLLFVRAHHFLGGDAGPLCAGAYSDHKQLQTWETELGGKAPALADLLAVTHRLGFNATQLISAVHAGRRRVLEVGIELPKKSGSRVLSPHAAAIQAFEAACRASQPSVSPPARGAQCSAYNCAEKDGPKKKEALKEYKQQVLAEWVVKQEQLVPGFVAAVQAGLAADSTADLTTIYTHWKKWLVKRPLCGSEDCLLNCELSSGQQLGRHKLPEMSLQE